ncbi:NADPH-dependent aldehyde reductase Ahr [Microbulbifer epialgicus]|uniref:NAD(P)-dependent alcohol dehydrogenase n=1 Tax=Microbulbifer epialgicus TaxID=393907 RepID=A0ABV4NYQ0_9GAMM
MIKAYAAHEPGGRLKPFEYDPGPLLDNQIEIAVEHCGICHSDLSMLNNEWGITKYPFVPGHEVVGKIIEVGAGVKSLAVGQTVGLGWHSGYCMTCSSCNGGDHNVCGSAQGTIIGRHGGFSDKVRADESSVILLPYGMDESVVAPLFCAGVTVFNPLLELNIKPTDTVGVIGIGGLGHLALQFLKAWGCEVWAFTSSDTKREEAINLGAHHTVNSKHKDELKALRGKFDLILSTVNVKLNWNQYINTLVPKGKLHFVGATLEPLDLNVFSLMYGQRSVSSSPVGSPQALRKMLSFAQRHDVEPKVERFSFNQINEAIARLESGKAHYRIVLSK